MSDLLYRLLAHPNVASKQWIVRQYDHEVQGGSVIKPLVGPGQDGPGDAAVLRPILTSLRGVAIGCGLQPGLGEKAVGGQGDSYWMALAAMDEAIRNVVCVGADPDRVAILDNFCWPGCDDPANLGALVRACQGCYDGALAYRTPFVSGKDSLNNQFTTEQGELITIPPTLLITALGIVPDVARCVSMDAKAAGHLLVVVGQKTGGAMGGSHFLMTVADESRDHQIPRVDLTTAPVAARAVASLIDQGRVRSAHDCSDGGFLVAAAEMAFAGRVGLDIDLAGVPAEPGYDDTTIAFSETPGRYLLEVAPDQWPSVKDALDRSGVAFGQVGIFTAHDRLTVWDQAKNQRVDESLDALRSAWLGSTSDP